ncbi:MAG: site-specific integrase [Sphingomonadales bacterium]|nr:site-specific integrase [Sphingomonadales bacterium]
MLPSFSVLEATRRFEHHTSRAGLGSVDARARHADIRHRLPSPPDRQRDRARRKEGRQHQKAFQTASARAGVHVTPYTLRHTGAVWAAEGGASMDELAQLMGHDDAATTSKRYDRYSPT